MDKNNPVIIVEDLTSQQEKKEREEKLIAERRTEQWNTVGVSELGAERALADEKAAVAAGFSVAPPIYTIGSLVNSVGVENFRASREEYEAMPTAEEACGNLVKLIQAEERQDKLVPVTGLVMLNDGRLHNHDNGTYPVTHRGLDGLCRFVTPGGGAYLKACEPELRAHNLNHWFPKGTREDVRATRSAITNWEQACQLLKKAGMKDMPPQPGPVYVDQQVTLRTRLNHSSEKREIFSVVGPRYGEYDIDKIAGQIMAGVPADSRADVVYDGYKARIDVLFHSNVQPERVVAGEIFKAGIMVKTADDGTGSIQIAAQVWRNLCLNLFIIDNAQDFVMRRKHFGDGIAIAVRSGIESALKKVEYFMDKWSEATVEKCVERYGHDAEECIRRLVANKVVHVAGVRPKDMYERLLTAFHKEPGDTPTAIVNAITRAAHEDTWRKWTDVEDLERLAGSLLFETKWDLDVKESEFERLQLTLD